MEPMPRLPLAATAVVTLLVVALSACAGTNAVRQDVVGSNGYQSGDAALTFLPLGHRPAVHGIAGTLIDGGHFDLSAWRGKVVVVNFWGQWCAPCQAEAEGLEQVFVDNRQNGVEFLGIDVKDDPASGR